MGIGGGAICTGIALAVKNINPAIRVYGVEPEGANSMRQSLDTGEAVTLEKVDTIADGLGSPLAGTVTFNLVKTYVEDVIIVSDKEIGNAMREILSWTKLLAEPAGAAATSAIHRCRRRTRARQPIAMAGERIPCLCVSHQRNAGLVRKSALIPRYAPCSVS